MSQAPAMPVFTDALIGDTTHLSTEEFGAYCLILFATWRNNGEPFADNDCRMARICRVSEARWLGKLRVVMVEFFDMDGGTWRQKRLEKEWNFCAELRVRKSDAGKASARARLLRNNDTVSTAAASVLQLNGQQNGNPHTHTHNSSKQERDDANASSGTQTPAEASDARSSKRGTRLPVDWQPDEQDCEFAGSLGLGVGLGDVAAEFRDYWIAVPGAKGCKLDWSATFRNRCRDIAKHRGGNRAGRPANSGPGDSAILAALDRVRIKGDTSGFH